MPVAIKILYFSFNPDSLLLNHIGGSNAHECHQIFGGGHSFSLVDVFRPSNGLNDIASLNNVVPSLDHVVIPSLDHVMVPSVDDMIPCLNDMVPSLDDMVPSLDDMVPSLNDMIPSLNDMIPSLNDMVPSLYDMVSGLDDVTDDDGLADDDAHVGVDGELGAVLLQDGQLGCAGASSHGLLERHCSGLRLTPPGSPSWRLDLGGPHLVDIAQVHFQRVLVGSPKVALVAFERLLPFVHRGNVSLQTSRGERREVTLVAFVSPDILVNCLDVVGEVNLSGSCVVTPIAEVVLGSRVVATSFMFKPDVCLELSLGQKVGPTGLAGNLFFGMLPSLVSFDHGPCGGAVVAELALEGLQGH